MDVLPELLEEKVFAEFTAADYETFARVINDSIAQDLKDYLKKPEADPFVVDNINNFLGSIIESFTLHFVIKERGILDLVQGLVPEQLAGSTVNLDDLIEKLSFVEQNSPKLMMKMPTRSHDDWDAFYSMIKNVCGRLAAKGVTLDRPDTVDIIQANKFVFYVPNAKAVSTGTGVISGKHNQWIISLRGAEYIRYCNENNIPYLKRRAF